MEHNILHGNGDLNLRKKKCISAFSSKACSPSNLPSSSSAPPSLCCSSSGLFSVPPTCQTPFRLRAFVLARPSVWNSLPRLPMASSSSLSSLSSKASGPKHPLTAHCQPSSPHSASVLQHLTPSHSLIHYVSFFLFLKLFILLIYWSIVD